MKIVRVFLKVSMAYSHPGLTALCKEYKITNLSPGDFIVFVNRVRDKIKVLTHNNLIAYLALPKGTRFDLSIIQHIPNAFNGASINYEKALGEAVTQALLKSQKRIVEFK